jgi:chitinase
VRAFEAAGVPASKIVLGVPFYGRMWGQVADVNHGLFQSGKPIPNSYTPYSAITATMLNKGYERFWDAASKVPSLYNKNEKIFVSYEDPESLALKCDYVRTHKLGGIMFWSYFNDSSGELLGTINHAMHLRSSADNANPRK